MRAIKKDFVENLRNLILKEYYSKLRIIMKIISYLNKNCKNEVSWENKSMNAKESTSPSPKLVSPDIQHREVDNNKLNIKLIAQEDDEKDKTDVVINKVLSKIKTKVSYNNSHLYADTLLDNHIHDKNDASSNDKSETTNNLNNLNADKHDKQTSDGSPSNNIHNILLCNDQEIMNALEGISLEYIIPAIKQYKELEQQFKIWCKETKNSGGEVFYPSVEIQSMKDDVFEYQEDN